jgi:hypothetical protein
MTTQAQPLCQSRDTFAGTVNAGNYIFLWERKRKSSIEQVRVEFFSDRMSYIVLRVRWCNIFVLNVHAQSGEKVMIEKIVL